MSDTSGFVEKKGRFLQDKCFRQGCSYLFYTFLDGLASLFWRIRYVIWGFVGVGSGTFDFGIWDSGGPLQNPINEVGTD
jgi:hypothetical protein